MAVITYSVSLPYRQVPNMGGLQPAVQVTLHNGTWSAQAVAIFDSGSIFTVFSREYAELLGIEDVTQGSRERISTLGGPLEIYLFDLEIQLEIGDRFAAQIGFFPVRASRNILGRSVIFSAFEIGFHERGQKIHLRPEA